MSVLLFLKFRQPRPRHGPQQNERHGFLSVFNFKKTLFSKKKGHFYSPQNIFFRQFFSLKSALNAGGGKFGNLQIVQKWRCPLKPKKMTLGCANDPNWATGFVTLIFLVSIMMLIPNTLQIPFFG